MSDWLTTHGWWVAILSALLGVASAAAGFAILITLPEDHFLRNEEEPPSAKPRRAIHPVLLVLKNAMGACVVAAGVFMSLPLVPGPGLVTVLIGLSLMSFPGKRKLELRLLRTRWPWARSIGCVPRTAAPRFACRHSPVAPPHSRNKSRGIAIPRNRRITFAASAPHAVPPNRLLIPMPPCGLYANPF